jgi:hypothetical protein
LLASLVAEAKGAWPRIVEIDRPRLDRALGVDGLVKTIEPGADPSRLAEDPELAFDLFHPVYDELSRGPAVVDVGANVMDGLIEWARETDLPSAFQDDNISPRFAFVASPDPNALTEALNGYERVRELFGSRADYVFVLNNADGSGFSMFHDLKVWEQLETEQKHGRANIVELPHCRSKVAKVAASRDASPVAALQNFEQYADELGLNKPGRNRDWNLQKRWTDQARAKLTTYLPE